MPDNRTKYKLTDDFIHHLIKATEGFLTADQLDLLVSGFESEAGNHFFTSASEANLIRISSAVYDKISFYLDCLKYPHHVEIVIAICANSNYLTDIIVRNPEYLHLVFQPSYLSKIITAEEIKNKLEESRQRYKTFNARLNFLRTVKRRYTLSIGINDILRNQPLEVITEQLSVLAKEIIAALFKLSIEENKIRTETDEPGINYSIAALGKLGGNELNYSSDVDLIIFYEKKNKESKSSIDLARFLTETIQLFIQSATDLTSKGYIFRLDFRLRPDGKNSPLTGTLSDYISYYESRGEDWERQMLIKLSFVGGDHQLFIKFKSYLESFIYPLSHRKSPAEQIGRIKLDIEKNLGDKQNVKLFSGGIRDIEFAVQALQLLNGGRNKSLRTGNTLEAIDALQKTKLLDKNEAKQFIEAYHFYRRTEHFLQLMNDTQTHVIPDEEEIQAKISYYLNFKRNSNFKKKLNQHRRNVRKIFNSIVELETAVPKKDSIQDYGINYLDAGKSNKNLRYLKTGEGLITKKEFDRQTIDQFLTIEPQLINILLKSSGPDRILENLVKCVRSMTLPSILYKEFENQSFMSQFLQICEYSQRAVDCIISDKSLIELLITRLGYSPEMLTKYELSNTNQYIFILAVQYSLGLLDSREVSSNLQSYILYKIRNNVIIDEIKFDFFIASLGSFGSGEIGFASDLDLIFITDDLPQMTDNQTVFQGLLASLREELAPFKVDCRLRPEGKSSQLVWQLNKYGEYINSRARVWELQSLQKLNFVTGSKTLFDKFTAIIGRRIQKLNTEEINNEMFEMFKKITAQTYTAITNQTNIKTDPGGKLSIDFIVQSHLLSDHKKYIDCLGSSIVEQTDYLKESGTDLSILKENYLFLKNVEMAIHNIFNMNKSQLPSAIDKQMTLSRFCGYDSDKKFLDALKNNLKFNREYFNNHFKKT